VSATSAVPAQRGDGTATKRRAEPARKREIVDAAVGLMYDAGFAGTSMRDIGRAVGLLSGSLYHYFAEKEDILYEIQLILNERIGAIPPAIDASGLDSLGRIRRFIELHLEMVEADLALCHVAYTEFRHLNPARLPEVRAPQQAYNTYLLQLIVDAQRSGDVDERLDPQTCAGAVFALLNSIIWWRRPGSHPGIDELKAAYAGILLDGMSTRAGRVVTEETP
jgi:AcrR family transcriptional regulator